MNVTYTCRKCGMEMPVKQKVCPRCGEITPAGGKFDVEEDVKWRPSAKIMWIAGSAVFVLILALVLYNVLHVVPPDQVAKEWFEAMASRSIRKAETFVTPRFHDTLAAKAQSLQTLSEEYNIETHSNLATYRIGKPVSRDATHAEVTVYLTYPGNTPGPEIKAQMVKIGRQWKVDQVL